MDTRTALNKGSELLEQGKYAEAYDLYTSIIDMSSKALKSGFDIIEMYPDLAKAYAKRCTVNLVIGELGKALKDHLNANLIQENYVSYKNNQYQDLYEENLALFPFKFFIEKALDPQNWNVIFPNFDVIRLAKLKSFLVKAIIQDVEPQASRVLWQVICKGTFLGKIFYCPTGIKTPSITNKDSHLFTIATQLQTAIGSSSTALPYIDEPTKKLLAADSELLGQLQKKFPVLYHSVMRVLGTSSEIKTGVPVRQEGEAKTERKEINDLIEKYNVVEFFKRGQVFVCTTIAKPYKEGGEFVVSRFLNREPNPELHQTRDAKGNIVPVTEPKETFVVDEKGEWVSKGLRR